MIGDQNILMFHKAMEDISLKSPPLVLSIIFVIIGTCGGPIVIRLYFLQGGEKLWLSSLLQIGGLPIPFLIILIASYIHRRKTQGSNAKIFHIQPYLLKWCPVIGFIAGLDNFLYAYGASKLPVSTSTLITATQLAFIAGFGFLLVKQKFTKYSITAIVFLTIGGVVLALHSSNDLPEGETNAEYVVGLVMTLGAAALVGLILPLVEFIFKRSGQEITFMLMMEVQTVTSFSAAACCLLGMFINNDFKDILTEAREYELGELKYYVILVLTAITYQCLTLGNTGVILYHSSLLSGVIYGIFLPVTEILAVVFYQETFGLGKSISLALSLLGFMTYFYGEIKHNKGQDHILIDNTALIV